MKRMMIVVVLAASCALLAGCPSKSSESSDDREPTQGGLPARPGSDLSTPESALKSYWALLDWLRLRHRIEEWRGGEASEQVRTGDAMSAVARGDALASFAQGSRRDLRLDRSIVSVTIDGDRHATVVAKIRSLSLDATAFTPTPIELFDIVPGGEFRYLLERDAEGWKVAEVWRVDEPGGQRRIR